MSRADMSGNYLNKYQNMLNRYYTGNEIIMLDSIKRENNKRKVYQYEQRQDYHPHDHPLDDNPLMSIEQVSNSFADALHTIFGNADLLDRYQMFYTGLDPYSALEDVPTPLKANDLHTLEKTKFSAITKEKLGRNDIDYECAICQSKFEPDEDVTLLPCSGRHYFHDGCINPWLSALSKKCPVCRDNLEDKLKVMHN
jgi:hypothetical protein